ncbi:hypothetical protein ABKN59_005546 [Abortiporus biennis]
MSHPKSYTAYAFTEKGGNLVKKTVDWKDPKPGQVVIKVLACGVCGSDEGVRYGAFGPNFPRVPGHEIVGEIVQVHPETDSHFKIGQRVGGGWHGGHCHSCNSCRSGDFITCENQTINGVTVDGGYAEYVTLRTEALVHVTEDIDPAEAAPMLCAGITTFNSLRNMGVKSGDTVAVQGVGGLGHFAIQFARAMGYRVVALSTSGAKKDLAEKLGAHIYIDGSQVDHVKALQEIGGARLIMCTAPTAKGVPELLNGLSVGGKLLILGVPPEPSSIPLGALISKRTSICGWPSGSAKDSEETVEFAKLAGIHCMIEKFPLEKAQEAYDHRSKARFRAVITP